MKNSSNNNMKEVFKLMEKIKMVEPSTSLYALTLNKIKRENIIPLIWVRIVACLLTTFIATEFFLALNEKKTTNMHISNVIYKTNNILYYE